MRLKQTLLEAMAVVAAGLAVGLTANAVTGSGLTLTRNHFPPAPPPSAAGPGQAAEDATEEGYRILPHTAVVALVESDAYREELHILIDARDDGHYREGHIPGAYQLDHYRSERYLEALLPVCENADKVVLYCNGGDCEDSKLAAGDLLDNGVDPEKIYVYLGGASRWREDGLPFEQGARLSDDLVYPEDE